MADGYPYYYNSVDDLERPAADDGFDAHAPTNNWLSHLLGGVNNAADIAGRFDETRFIGPRPIQQPGRRSFKKYNSWRGKDGKIHYRNGKGPKPKPKPSAAGGLGSVGMNMDLASQVDPNLGPFGSPNMGNVNDIVKSIIADATKQYRHANQDVAYDLKNDLGSIAGSSLAYDRGAAALGAGNEMMHARLNGDALLSKGLRDALAQRTNAMAQQQAQMGGQITPHQLSINADSNADFEMDKGQNASEFRGFNEMLNFSRLANVEDSTRAMQGTRAAARKAMADNNRALAEIRAQRGKAKFDVEKQLWDMHIARKLAEAEYAGRGETVANAQYDRLAGDRTAGLQAAELVGKATTDNAKYQNERAKLLAKNGDRALKILYGTPKAVKGMPQFIKAIDPQTGKEILDANNNPIVKLYTPEGYQQVDLPEDMNDAIRRLRAAGLNGPRWEKLARQWWAGVVKAKEDAFRRSLIEPANNAFNSIGNSSWGIISSE